MASQNNGFPMGNPVCRIKLNQYVCVVCGELQAGVTGYLFYQSGRTRMGAPFCKTHLDQFPEYASPVFENQPVLNLFRQMFPQTYLEDVEGKPTLFFNTYRLKNQTKSIMELRGGREWLNLHRNLLQTAYLVKPVLILVSWSLPKAPPVSAPYAHNAAQK